MPGGRGLGLIPGLRPALSNAGLGHIPLAVAGCAANKLAPPVQIDTTDHTRLKPLRLPDGLGNVLGLPNACAPDAVHEHVACALDAFTLGQGHADKPACGLAVRHLGQVVRGDAAQVAATGLDHPVFLFGRAVHRKIHLAGHPQALVAVFEDGLSSRADAAGPQQAARWVLLRLAQQFV